MKKIIRDHSWFYFLFLIFILIGTVHLLLTSKGALVLWFNDRHHSFLDWFFVNATKLGEGIVFVSVMIILLFIRYRFFFFTGISFGLSVGIAQLLKHTIFSSSARPSKYFGDISLHVVDGIHLHSENSFPSGHTAAAFALLFALAMITKNKWLQVFFCSLAFACALSRVYLAQHFFEDVYAASLLSVFITTVTYYFLFPHREMNSYWLDKSILNFAR